MPKITLNKSALNLVNKFCDEADKYGVNVEKSESGATLMDAGIEAALSFHKDRLPCAISLGFPICRLTKKR